MLGNKSLTRKIPHLYPHRYMLRYMLPDAPKRGNKCKCSQNLQIPTCGGKMRIEGNSCSTYHGDLVENNSVGRVEGFLGKC